MTDRPTLRRRLKWRLQARRHRKLDPPNMSEMPWSRYAMDEPNGEIYDARTWSRRAARRRFVREHGWASNPVTVMRRHARYMTTQEIWQARNRTDEWLALQDDAAFAAGKPELTPDQYTPPPADAPPGWEPDSEWDPAWTFCPPTDDGAAPVWFCEADA